MSVKARISENKHRIYRDTTCVKALQILAGRRGSESKQSRPSNLISNIGILRKFGSLSVSYWPRQTREGREKRCPLWLHKVLYEFGALYRDIADKRQLVITGLQSVNELRRLHRHSTAHEAGDVANNKDAHQRT